jgi:hypothetical protein
MSVQSWQNGLAVCTSDFIRKRMHVYDAEFLCGNVPFRLVWCRARGNPNHCFQYFSSLPVLHYLQVVHFIKNWNNCLEYLIQYSLKSGGTKDHFRPVKVTGTAPYWKACVLCQNILFNHIVLKFSYLGIWT